MSLKAKYCAHCKARLTTREVEDRPREVCTGCGTIFYKNPLPVAASVILNEARDVLLVKRKNEPHKGKWCLPIGFAEIGETIGQAAQRELKEETGVEGRILRLLDADSHDSDFYGELLIVTFELEKVGGTEEAGDDAEAVSYFPLSWLPPLAFSSNDKALKACVVTHRDEWAIQDSFESLQEDKGAELLSDALVAMIRDSAEEVGRAWLADVRSNPTTLSHGRFDPEKLLERATTALTQFGRWLKGNEADQEVRDFYQAIGRERSGQGFAVHELTSSLTLLRKHVWTHARTHGIWRRPIDVYRVLELNRRIALFFDKAMYNVMIGFDAGKKEQNAT